MTYQSYAAVMAKLSCGIISVIFVAQRTGLDADGYASTWRDHPEHAAIRDAGRDRWYSDYSLHVAQVTRSYDWKKA